MPVITVPTAVELKISMQDFLVIMFTPLIDQLFLLNWIGTEFLTIPLRSKIEEILKMGRHTLPEFLLFFYLSLYTDLKLKDYLQKLDDSIKLITNEYIAELLFFKVSLYYMFRPEGSPDIPHLEAQLKKLFGIAKDISRKNAETFVESMLRESKKDFQKKSDPN